MRWCVISFFLDLPILYASIYSRALKTCTDPIDEACAEIAVDLGSAMRSLLQAQNEPALPISTCWQCCRQQCGRMIQPLDTGAHHVLQKSERLHSFMAIISCAPLNTQVHVPAHLSTIWLGSLVDVANNACEELPPLFSRSCPATDWPTLNLPPD